jgi:hypothetical protein
MDFLVSLIEASNDGGTARSELEEIARRLKIGARPGQIVETLVDGGWPREDAMGVVGHANAVFRSEMCRQALRRASFGFVWLAAGLTVTIVTFVYRNWLGFTFAADGAILFGLIGATRGLLGWLKYRS